MNITRELYFSTIWFIRDYENMKAEAADLLDRNSAFFAGGDVPQEDKDAFFQAVMTAYVTAKEEARKKFTPAPAKGEGGHG